VDLVRLQDDAWPVGQRLTRDDYLVILGDFGLNINWNPEVKPQWFYWLSKQPWTTLFVDGNHDDIPYLNQLPTMEWGGGIVGKAHRNVLHLRRGEVYHIGWSTFFVMGGATSIDKQWRTPGKSWFPQEIPNQAEWDNAIKNLEPYGGEVDNVLAHTMPFEIAKKYLGDGHGMFALSEKDSVLEKDFQNFIDTGNLKFNNWYCGHWHPYRRWDYDKYHCFYHHIESLDICPEDIGREL
jgi:hypothetical protein